MTTRELLELASLDAMGLLDDTEHRSFESAFRASAPAVQRQVRREQERLTGDVSTLPEVDPPADLHDRVMDRVREAIGAARQDVVGRLVPGEFSIRANVSPLWRAACIGFATATLVLFGVGYTMQNQYQTAMRVGQSGEIAEIARELGPKFVQVLMSPTGERVAFASTVSHTTPEEPELQAAIYFDIETKTAFLVCKNLPAVDGDTEYRLVLVDDEGGVADQLARFPYTGGLVGARVPADAKLTSGTLGIVPVAGGKPVMLSL